MMDVATIVAAVKGAVDSAKEIGSLTRDAKDRKVNDAVLGLQQRLITVQGLVMDLLTENNGLRQRLSDLEHTAQQSEQFKFMENMYWKGQDGPFCPNCLDSERKAVRLISTDEPTFFRCGICKNSFDRAPHKAGGKVISQPSPFDDT